MPRTFDSPARQGMNTGMQDAFNLAWKLAFVVRESACAIGRQATVCAFREEDRRHG